MRRVRLGIRPFPASKPEIGFVSGGLREILGAISIDPDSVIKAIRFVRRTQTCVIPPTQIAVGFVLENCVIVYGGRQTCPKAGYDDFGVRIVKEHWGGNHRPLFPSGVMFCSQRIATRRRRFEPLSPIAAPLWRLSGKARESALENHLRGKSR